MKLKVHCGKVGVTSSAPLQIWEASCSTNIILKLKSNVNHDQVHVTVVTKMQNPLIKGNSSTHFHKAISFKEMHGIWFTDPQKYPTLFLASSLQH